MPGCTGILESIRGSDPEARRRALRLTTQLFTEAPHHEPAALQAFGALFDTLLDSVEMEARASFAHAVAPRADLPPSTAERLARGDAAAAAPILERTPGLADRILVRVAKEGTQDHLHALAGRRELGEIVTDILVDRGERRVVHRVAANEGARFSPLGERKLAEHAKGDEQLQAIILDRGTLSPSLLEAVLPVLTRHLVERLERAGHRLAGKLPPAVAERLAGRLTAMLDETRDQNDGPVSADHDADVIRFCTHGNMLELCRYLARAAQLPLPTALLMFNKAADEPLIIVARALNVSRDTFEQLLAMKARFLKGGYTRTDETVERFEAMTVAEAQRTLRFVVARMKVA